MANSSQLAKMNEWEMKCKFNKRTGLFWNTPANIEDLTKHLHSHGIVSTEMGRWSIKSKPNAESLKCRWTDAAGLTIAEVHYYELPDGRIGGTGRHLPDPMLLVHEGVEYEREKEPPPVEGSPFRFDGRLYWLVKVWRWARCLILNR